MTTRVDSSPRLRGERGQGVIEVLTAMGITALAGMIMILILQVLKSEATTEAKSISDGRVATAMLPVMAAVREARAVGTCANPVGAPLSSCRAVAEQPFTFIQAQPLNAGGVCFYAAPITAAPLTIPDRVCVHTHPGANGTTNLVRTVTPGGGTYTTPVWTGTPTRTLVVADVDVAATNVMYTLDDGSPAAASYTAAAQLRTIALVEFDITVQQRIARSKRVSSSTLEFSAAPRGSRYSRDQDYTELGG